MRVRGSGSARAVTITSWSALATVTRSRIRTIRDNEPSTPDVSPTRSTRSPGTTRSRPSSRAFIAMACRSPGPPASTSTVYRPRSTPVTNPTSESACSGRVLVRGRVPRRPGRIRTSESSRARRAMLSYPRRVRASREHPGPQADEVGDGLGRRGDALDADAGDRESDQCARGRHPVVLVRAHRAGPERARRDDEAVRRLLGLPTQPRDLGRERGKTVGLVAAQVRDPAQAGRGVAEGGERGDRRGELAGGVHDEVDAVDRAGAAHREHVTLEPRRGPHALEDAGQEPAGL